MEKQTENVALEDLIKKLDEQLNQADDSLSFVSPLTDVEFGSQRQRCVLIEIGHARFTIPIAGVAEIGSLPQVTILPNLPGWIYGVVSLRGEVVSVIDLVGYFDWNTTDAGNGSRLVVIHHQGMKVGLRVDRIVGSVNIDIEKIVENEVPWPAGNGVIFPNACTIDNELYCVVDVPKLLKEKKMVDC